MNPLDLDFAPWQPAELVELRKSLWVSRDELVRHPNHPQSYPSKQDMALRIGVAPDKWRHWERTGVPSNGWAALLRIYEDERREITPLNCAIAALDALAEVVGDYSELARALEVDRRTVNKWRYSIGYVPGRLGYGRIVRICFEDICT